MNRSPKIMTPQQVRAATPPIIGSVIAGGWDRGEWRTLNLDALRQLWRLFERIQPIGKLDTRDQIEVEFEADAEEDDVLTEKLTVPAGQIWFIQKIVVVTPADDNGAEYHANFRVSCFVDDADPPSEHGQLYWATDKHDGGGESFVVDFWTGAPGLDYGAAALNEAGARNHNLDVPLRLAPGDYITLVGAIREDDANAGGTVTLTPYGYKARLLGA